MLNLSSKARLYINVIAVRKYNFLDSFLFCFVYKTIFAVTIDSKYHSLNWKDVSVTNVDIFEQPLPQGAFPWLWRERGKSALVTRLIFEKNQFSLQFFHSLLQVYIVYRVAFIFHLNAFLVLGFAYLLCWPSGRGIGLVCTRRFSFHEFLIFNFFSLLENLFFYPRHLPTPTTHDPLPTNHDPRHLDTLEFESSKSCDYLHKCHELP